MKGRSAGWYFCKKRILKEKIYIGRAGNQEIESNFGNL